MSFFFCIDGSFFFLITHQHPIVSQSATWIWGQKPSSITDRHKSAAVHDTCSLKTSLVLHYSPLSPLQPSLTILLRRTTNRLIQNRWTSSHPPISRKPRGKSQRMVRTWWGTAKKKTKQPRRSCSRRHFPIFVIYQVWQHCAACCQGWKLRHAGLVDFHPTKSTSFYNQWTPHNLLVLKSI